MTDEKEVSQDSSTVAQSTTGVTTEELISASKETEGKKETKPVEKTAEQVEHDERSNLGRKVKKLEETLVEMNEALQELRSSKQTASAPQADLPEYISTPDDVEKYLTVRERKQKEEQVQYQGVYAKTFRSVGKEDPDIYEEVFNEMFEHFNVVRTGSPEIDAELNYAKAKASVLSKKSATPAKARANVKGGKTEVSTNLSVESRADDTPVADIQLDDFAKEFVTKTGMKQESIRGALKEDTPIHLRGR